MEYRSTVAIRIKDLSAVGGKEYSILWMRRSPGEEYGNTVSWERVGVGSLFGISALQYAAVEMREQAWQDSMNPDGFNTGGTSAGFMGDELKLGGGWCYSDGTCHSELLGGVQGGPGKFFGISYSPGSIIDYTLEAYAGPHDYLTDSLMFGHNGYLPDWHGFKYFASEVVSGVNIVLVTPIVAASVVPVGMLPRIATGH